MTWTLGLRGDMHKTRCRLSLTESTKYCFILSCVSGSPGKTKDKDKRQKTKDKRQRTKDKRQKTKDKRQETRDKGQESIDMR